MRTPRQHVQREDVHFPLVVVRHYIDLHLNRPGRVAHSIHAQYGSISLCKGTSGEQREVEGTWRGDGGYRGHKAFHVCLS